MTKKYVVTILLVIFLLSTCAGASAGAFVGCIEDQEPTEEQRAVPTVTAEDVSNNPEDFFVGCWYFSPVVGDGNSLFQNFFEDHTYQIIAIYCPNDPSGCWQDCTYNVVANDYWVAYGTWAYADGEMTITLDGTVIPRRLPVHEEEINSPLVFSYAVSDLQNVAIEDLPIWDPDSEDRIFLATGKFGSEQFWKISDRTIESYYEDFLL